MKELTKDEVELFKTSEHQKALYLLFSPQARYALQSLIVLNKLPTLCKAVIAGGFPRDCLLRDGDWSDVDIFFYPDTDAVKPEHRKFSYLCEAFVKHPLLQLGLLRTYSVKTNAMQYNLYLYIHGEDIPREFHTLHTRLYRLQPCAKLGPVTGGSDGFPLSFRGTPNELVPNLNIMLRDEQNVQDILSTFPLNISKVFIRLFPTFPEVITTAWFEDAVESQNISLTIPLNTPTADEVRMTKYFDKIHEKFPTYSGSIQHECPF